MSQLYVFGDTETTGVTPDAKIVEVAWIVTDVDFNVVGEVSSLIDPEIPISQSASRIHGITNAAVKGAPTIDAFMADHAALWRNPETRFCFHNAAFDVRYLKDFMCDDPFVGCTLRLARRLLPDVANHKLQTLRYTFNLGGGVAHSALGDVLSLVDLFKMFVEDTGMSPDEVLALSNAALPVSKMTFGKHKGTPLAELPRSYRTWLLALDNLDADLRAALQPL